MVTARRLADPNRLGLVGCLAILLFSVVVSDSVSPMYSSAARSGANHVLNSTVSTSNMSLSGSALIWFFGYVGNSFYPKIELNISEQTMIDTAKNLSETFGKKNLVLLTSVDEIPTRQGTINESMIPKIAHYVAQLKKYASAVFGRLDLIQFNLTESPNFGNCSTWSNCPIYNQSSIYINELGLNGIWFDHPAYEMNALGNVTFNKMMQNLTDLFPKAQFILNQATPPSKYGYITELAGYSWENSTYIAPSPSQGYLVDPSAEQLQQFYARFQGHVIMHMDAAGPPGVIEVWKEPMSVFANLSSSSEVLALDALVYNGTHAIFENESYNTVIPIIGSWTFDGTVPPTCGAGCPNYHGTLYNSLDTGTYARSTLASFEQIVIDNVLQ